MCRRHFLGIAGLGAMAPCWVSGDGKSDGTGPGLVIQFDDGWTNWNETAAPVLKEVGGRATAFVCNQYIDSGRTSVKRLRALQDDFGWEIGTHCYHHVNAPRYVQKNGLQKWLDAELDASLKALNAVGLNARSLVFPFNALTPELGRAVMGRVESYRCAETLAIAPGVRADGSVPGTTIDIAQYTPVDVVNSWIDFAARKKEVLFLYGHRVLPDEQFTEGAVTGVDGAGLTVGVEVNVPPGEELELVVDPAQRASRRAVLRVVSAKGRQIRVEDGAAGMPAIGDTFLMGPSYGTRLSEFRAILDYAGGKLPFYTLHDIAMKNHLVPVPAQD